MLKHKVLSPQEEAALEYCGPYPRVPLTTMHGTSNSHYMDSQLPSEPMVLVLIRVSLLIHIGTPTPHKLYALMVRADVPKAGTINERPLANDYETIS